MSVGLFIAHGHNWTLRGIEEVRVQIAASLPAKRYGQPEEFASVAAFLMSVAVGYVTGQMTRVDGGMIASL